MRTVITITGIGKKKSGVSAKTGNSYEFTPISFTYDAPFVDGQAAASCTVFADVLGDYEPSIGDVKLAIVRERYNPYRVEIEAFLS